MRLEARELKTYLETVPREQLVEGDLYFSVSYVDDELLQPTLFSVVFVGKNLEPGDQDKYYFQDLDSYAAGVRHSTASEGAPATFHAGDIVN